MARCRHRLARGLYEDAYGLAAVVQVGRTRREKRFPRDTPLARLKVWQLTTRAELTNAQPVVVRGSLRADAPRYLALVAHLASRRSRACDLAAWVARIGDTPRHLLTRGDLEVTLQAWRATGLAASTLNHRLTAIRHLFVTLDGDAGPARGLKRVPPPKPAPRGLPLRTLRAVLAKMPATATKARCLVLLFTGMRPAQLRRVRPQDVQLGARPPYVTISAAKGGEPQVNPLSLEGVAAFRALAHFDAFGRFDTGALNRSWQRACAKVGVTSTAYDLRHSYATTLLAGGADLADVQALLGHADIRQTRRYAPVLQTRLDRHVVSAFDGGETAGLARGSAGK